MELYRLAYHAHLPLRALARLIHSPWRTLTQWLSDVRRPSPARMAEITRRVEAYIAAQRLAPPVRRGGPAGGEERRRALRRQTLAARALVARHARTGEAAPHESEEAEAPTGDEAPEY